MKSILIAFGFVWFISHLNVFLTFIEFSEFEILVGILVNESPVNNFDRIFSQKRHSPPNDPPFPTG